MLPLLARLGGCVALCVSVVCVQRVCGCIHTHASAPGRLRLGIKIIGAASMLRPPLKRREVSREGRREGGMESPSANQTHVCVASAALNSCSHAEDLATTHTQTHTRTFPIKPYRYNSFIVSTYTTKASVNVYIKYITDF